MLKEKGKKHTNNFKKCNRGSTREVGLVESTVEICTQTV